jgi:hypothetical protein
MGNPAMDQIEITLMLVDLVDMLASHNASSLHFVAIALHASLNALAEVDCAKSRSVDKSN